jgi:tetratricopeptide (TPR) repeat protein
MQTSLHQAITMLKMGDKKSAEEHLSSYLESNPGDESGWLWLATAMEDEEQRRYCLEKVVELNPDNQIAQRYLHRLNLSLVREAEVVRSLNGDSSATKETTPPQNEPSSWVPIWFFLDKESQEAVVLGDSALRIYRMSKEDFARARADYRQTGRQPVKMAADEKIISYASVTEVFANLHTQKATIRYKPGKFNHKATLSFADAEQRDIFFKALQSRLNGRVRFREKRVSLLQASTLPASLLWMLMIAIYVTYETSREIAAGVGTAYTGQYQLVRWSVGGLLEAVGPGTVLLIGGLLFIGSILWWVNRAMNLPTIWTLVPEDNE